MHPVMGFLVRVGTFGAAVEGARLLARGVGKVTSGTVAGDVIAGWGDKATSLLDPLHLFTADPADQRDAEKKRRKAAEKQKKKEAAAKKKAQQQAEAAEAQAAEAERRAIELEKQAALAEQRAQHAEAEAKKNKARSSRRLATLSRGVASSARAQPDPFEGMRLAIQAFQLGQSAKNPPVDPRQALTSDMSNSVKSLVTDIIDSVNRDQEPNYEQLVARIEAGDQGAYDDLLDQADSLNGDETSGHACCEACASGGKGTCNTCTGKGPKSLADMPTAMLYGPDGGDVISGVGLTEDDIAELERYGVAGDDWEKNADRLIAEIGSCNTGSCRVR